MAKHHHEPAVNNEVQLAEFEGVDIDGVRVVLFSAYISWMLEISVLTTTFQGAGYDTDYHPAQMHPPDQAHDQAHADAEKEKEPAAEKDGEGPLHKGKCAHATLPPSHTNTI